MAHQKAFWIILIVLMTGTASLKAQVSVDQYYGDGIRYVRSQQEVFYDNYFHAAQFAVSATVNNGMVAFSLEVTYQEGMLHVSQGDSLTLVLRGGDHVVLKTDRGTGREDIIKRHFRNRNEYYVTCHYMMSNYDIQRITRNRVTKLSAQTGNMTFDRKLDNFQDRFRRQFTALYRYLMGSK